MVSVALVAVCGGVGETAPVGLACVAVSAHPANAIAPTIVTSPNHLTPILGPPSVLAVDQPVCQYPTMNNLIGGMKAPRHRLRFAFAALVTIAIAALGLAVPTQPASAAVGSDLQQAAAILKQAYDAKTFSTQPDSIYQYEILPYANGGAPTADCQVDLRVLQTLDLALQWYGQVEVTDINRPCIGSSLHCGSPWYSVHCVSPALAFDMDVLGNQALHGSETIDQQFLDNLNTVATGDASNPIGANVGQSQCRPPLDWAHLNEFTDDCTHQHVDFRNVTAQLNLPTPPTPPTPPANAQPRAHYDSVSSSSAGSIVGSGWAYDPDDPATASNVAFYLDNVRVAVAPANAPRPDVGNTYPGIGPNHGFSQTIWANPGTHTLGVTALDTASGQEFGLGTMSVTVSGTKPTSRRIDGSDRYAAAAALSVEGYPSGAPVAYVASGQNAVDVVSASSAAAKLGGPLLLNDGTGLQAATQTELQRLQPSRVFVVGGTSTIPDSVLAATRTALPNSAVTRLDGADRYEVSRNVIRSAAFANPPVLFVVDSNAWTDGLTAGSTAAFNQEPLLIVNGPSGTVDSATSALITELHPQAIRVIGGPGGVSNETLAALNAIVPTLRVYQTDRFSVAVDVANRTYPGMTKTTAYIVSGVNYADGMSASILAAKNASPLFLSRAECVDQSTLGAIYKFGVQQTVLVGGTATLSTDVAALKPCGV